MFGYVIANGGTLTEEQKNRFRAVYCGMCHILKHRYGNLSRFTLSYDMTFLAFVLSALYEGKEQQGKERCAAHPFKEHSYTINPYMEYAVDLNIMLAYHKCVDDWNDDRNILSKGFSTALKRAYIRAKDRNPGKERVIADWMDEIRKIETNGERVIDLPVNATGKMMAELFCIRTDEWHSSLWSFGDGLGKFIYFMDAYDDLEQDLKRQKYNPLRSVKHQPDYEDFCKAAMTMMLAECADGLEMLPIVRDVELIRNIVYSGVWSRYNYLQRKKDKRKEKGAE